MTKYEKARQEEIARHLANRDHDQGAAGRVFELECASAGSHKTRVSKQGEADVYIHLGKGNVRAEVKTNGGRIASLRLKNAPRFVIYRLQFTQKHKAGKNTEAWEERREIDPVLIPTDVFLAALDRFGATKSTNGKNPEEAIQVSSKKFFEWLLDWPIPYEPGTVYTEDDFEGLKNPPRQYTGGITMDHKEVIKSYSLEEHARLDYAAHLWRRCGYEAEAEAAQAKADNYYLTYENALRVQAGLPEITLEELKARRPA